MITIQCGKMGSGMSYNKYMTDNPAVGKERSPDSILELFKKITLSSDALIKEKSTILKKLT